MDIGAKSAVLLDNVNRFVFNFEKLEVTNV